MRLPGQIAAAIEVLQDVTERHRPASLALADWARNHRFAGSRDRSVIGTLVFDALRQRTSLAWRMNSETPRALVLGTLRYVWRLEPAEIGGLCDGEAHAPPALSPEEEQALCRGDDALSDAPDWVQGDLPEWLLPELKPVFGEELIAEGQGLARRAPIDLRVNTLKADRERVLKALGKFAAMPAPFSPLGVRIPAPGAQQKNPNVEAETAHGRGWFELQDEASQIATLLSGAGPRMQVLDICAGSGGKTLGLAAQMQNTGQIHAYDSDRQRLRPIFERLKRAGARNVQVMEPGDEKALAALAGRMDLVFVDAPCSGSGVWRRRPDSKWRLSPEALAQRTDEQRQVLTLAAPLVKPGGRLVYATCSILPSENRGQTEWALAQWRDFQEIPWADLWRDTLACDPPEAAIGGDALQLSPLRHGTDGFYVSVLRRCD